MDPETLQAMVQGVNQYVVGVTIGTITDNIFARIPIEPDRPFLIIAKQLGQIAVNGLFIMHGIRFLHGNPPPQGYSDPTGGYLFLFGLYDGQPNFKQTSTTIINAISTVFDKQSALYSAPKVSTTQGEVLSAGPVDKRNLEMLANM